MQPAPHLKSNEAAALLAEVGRDWSLIDLLASMVELAKLYADLEARVAALEAKHNGGGS